MRTTVPVALAPPVTVEGETEKLAMVLGCGEEGCGLSVSVAETVFADEAVMVAVVEEATGEVDIGKNADV